MSAQTIKPLSLILIILSIVMLPISLMGMLVLVFLFDAPGSMTSPLTVSLAVGLMGAPVLFSLSIGKAVAALRQSSTKELIRSAGLLLAPITFIGITVGLIETVCDGSFVC